MESVSFVPFTKLPFSSLSDTVSSRKVVGESLMFIEHQVKKGHSSLEECHENEQLTFVKKGALRFTVEGQIYFLKEGDLLRISRGVRHRCEALEESLVLEVFSPPRAEWMKD